MQLAAHTARHIQLDPKRIAGISATLAAHVALFMVLFAPAQFTPPAPVADVDSPQIYPEIERKPPPPIPVPKDPPKHEAKPHTTIPVAPVQDPRPVDTYVEKDAVVDDDSNQIALADTTFEEDVLPPGPQELAVLFGPAPAYPMIALRQGVEGRVILRIEVDASGHPTAGVIEKSSGSRLLDSAALKTVLAKWRFEPAKSGGQPIAATALVPVEFSLAD